LIIAAIVLANEGPAYHCNLLKKITFYIIEFIKQKVMLSIISSPIHQFLFCTLRFKKLTVAQCFSPAKAGIVKVVQGFSPA